MFSTRNEFHSIPTQGILNGILKLWKFRENYFENQVIDALSGRDRHWPWFTARAVVARLKRDALFRFADALFPPRLTGIRSLASCISVLPVRIRYFFYRTFAIPSQEDASKILRDLWKRNLVICSPDSSVAYQLK